MKKKDKIMKKIVRLTENDLTRIVKKVIREQSDEKYYADIHGYHAIDLDKWQGIVDKRPDWRTSDWRDEYEEVDTFDDLESFESSPYRRDYEDEKHGIKQFHFDDDYKDMRSGGPMRVLKRRKNRIKEQADPNYPANAQKTMNLSNHEMDMLPNFSDHPNEIEVIVAVGCGINTLPPVEYLPQSLMVLNLKNNDITEADLEGYAEGLPNLARIALDNNPIEWANEDEIARLEEEGQVLVTL